MVNSGQSTLKLYRNTFLTGVWWEIPVFRLMLGLCPTLAVTAAVKPAFTMGMCVLFVLICSNIVVSLMRNLLKPHLRIMMFTLTIATFVTIADLFLKAFQPEMSEALGPYVPLIIVNCIIIARAEACASKNGLIVSFIDAVGMGIGFTIALCILASIRELLSSGAIAEVQILPLQDKGGWFVPWTAMALPVGAFITLGLLLALANLSKRTKKV
jgi:electron transport complex protein RnfE